jgi:uncharacterized protein YbcI
MTKGQVEAKISEGVSKFEVEFMGRGPQKIKTVIAGDLVIIRLMGFLSQAERQIVENNEGVELLKKMRTMLFEKNLTQFHNVINDILPFKILSTHSDVSTVTGEKIIVITFDSNIEETIIKLGDE